MKIIAEWKDARKQPANKNGDKVADKVVQEFTAEDILKIFSRITEKEMEMMGFNPKWNRPEWMICTVLPVPPPAVRPSIIEENGQRREDDLTHKLSDIIKTNKQLSEKICKGASEDTIKYVAMLLQYHVFTFINNQMPGLAPAQQRNGRKPITDWLYTALARNLPYNVFVAELVNPGTESEGFANGITWRGTVNASMVPPMQAAHSVAQVFLGVNLKCASCHDSFINEYTLKDAYGLASIYANGPLEIAECDKPTGHIGKVKFLYEEIGLIDARADSATRKRQLADVITGRTNGRLPRTIVNRVWQRFMGYGLVEPIDEMDRPAWSPALMDWLAEDLAAHRYDLKHTMARILTSRAYQLPAVNVGETEEHFIFRGPAVRRLSAEQFSDAIMTLAGMNYPKADAKLNRDLALQRGKLEVLPLTPKWIWATANAHVKAPPASVLFKRVVPLAAAPTEAWLTIAADNSYAVSINGKNAASASKRSSTGADIYDVRAHLKKGDNTITVTALNFLPEGTSPIPREAEGGTPVPLPADADNPAGLILYARVRAEGAVMDFVSDDAWTAAVGKAAPTAACELGGVDLAPWRVGGHFLELAASHKDTLAVERASLVAADPLMAALGRPNREQIMTVRQGTATTLQALELTNGSTLAVLLKKAAEKILADAPVRTSPAMLVTGLYRHALSRPPTTVELAAAAPLVGSPASSEGVQDLLWALAMLPEFQLIK